MTQLNFVATIAADIASYVDTITGQSEKHLFEIKLAAGVSDTSLTLGTITHPKLIYVQGGSGISLKLVGGTDVIPANPSALITNLDGFANASILLSNSSGVELTVYILVAE